MLSKPNNKLVDVGLQEAIKRLLKRDYYLLEHDVNERSISHRLGQHLQEIFTDWHERAHFWSNLKSNNLSLLWDGSLNEHLPSPASLLHKAYAQEAM